PHALRPVAKAVRKNLAPPQHLCNLIVAPRKRQDGMMHTLRDGVADAMSFTVLAVRLDDALVHLRCVKRQPRAKRLTDVERDMVEVADLRVGAVALRCDTLVPVSIGRSVGLD